MRREGMVGVVCALERELGGLRERVVGRRSVAGLELLEVGDGVLAVVSGVGKVRAAAAAATLLAAGVDRALLVVGVCGALRRGLVPGDLVHCTRAVQADLAVVEDREFEADANLLASWREVAGGEAGWFVTADRPVLNPWRRARLARAFLGPCVADMETAAVAAVAARAEIPWAALRCVSDHAGFGAQRAFRRHFVALAGQAADTLPKWIDGLRLPGSPPTPPPPRTP
ncbi:MAG: hypothetical protein P1V81_07200 [Planctomycetota bacterium]|nr:hypothetical protein [Planctomycetota bacterium]